MQNVYLGGKQIGRVYIGNQSISNVRNLPEDFTIEYVVVAGGGGGGRGGAGGGAGGLLSGSVTLTKHYSTTNLLTVTVGYSGSAGSGSQWSGSNGGNSFLGGIGTFNITAIGGGGGGGLPYTTDTGYSVGALSGSNGGSGGGGGGITTGSQGLGTIGQGFNGGWLQGGGGGASQTGSQGTAIQSGNGGAGVYLFWNKYNSGRLADGGGGGSDNRYGAGVAAGNAGGLSGGAGGGVDPFGAVYRGNPAPAAGGGGGGGGGVTGTIPFSEAIGGEGGSGIVLIRYAGTTQRAIGGEVYVTGSYTVHAFTASGNFSF